MQYSTVQLDDSAKLLYASLDGIEDPKQFYASEQQQLNDWRRSMVEFVYLLAYTLNNYRLSDTFEQKEEDFKPLLKEIKRMLEIPKRKAEQKLTIRHRGLAADNQNVNDKNGTAEFDFVISCGDCVIDKPYLTYLVKSKIIDEPKLITKLDKAFQFFALAGIYIIEINLKDWDKYRENLTNVCLMLWARYINEISKESPQKIVYNESNNPDPNLTIMAKINKFRREDLQKIVNLIHSHYIS